MKATEFIISEKEFLDAISFKPLFFILKPKEKETICIEKEVDYGYRAVVIKYIYRHSREPKYQFEISPFFIAYTYIHEILRRGEIYDFTHSVKEAYLNCI